MDTSNIVKGSWLEGNDIDIESRLRVKEYYEKSIDKGSPIPQGWNVKTEYKTRTRLIKEKSIGTKLEDKVWLLFKNLGAEGLSSSDLTLLLRKIDDVEKTKQIDVVALVDDVVFVAECKSSETLGPKSLKKDIAEFAGNISSIRTSMRKVLKVTGLQFVFIFATENIEWDENDKLDAESAKIIIWDEYDILALQELAKIAGYGAKYQIYNRLFFGKKVKGFEIRVPALKAKMGGHTYYSFVLSPDDLLKIAYVHHRSGQSSFLELSNSYQRMINRTRIRNIESFIGEGGFFPGNVILNLHKPLLKEEYIGEKKHLDQLKQVSRPVAITLPPYYGSAWIIDGQHRLYGYADINERFTETLPVIAFVGEDASLEAKVFVDINRNQKSIEANLLWDLYEDLYPNSLDPKEQELYAISVIVKQLNSRTKSPFLDHISIPKEQNYGNLSLRAMCTSISQQRLISREETLLFRSSIEETIEFTADRIEVFFDVIRDELKEEWDAGDKHYVRTNAGMYVLMGILRDMIEGYLQKPEIDDLLKYRKATRKFLEPLLFHLLDSDGSVINGYRGAGGAGQKSRQVRYELTKVIREEIEYRSVWMEKYEESLEEADRFEKRKEGIKYYIERDESETLEFKGSVGQDLNRYLHGDGQLIEDPNLINEGVLKSIVAFLNTKGGEILIGVLELNKYEDVLDEKLNDSPIYDSKIIFGIQSEYRKDGWDGYLQRLINFIESRIGADVLNTELVQVSKLLCEDKELALITIQPAEAKRFLLNKDFFIRRMNSTVQLHGAEIDQYWSSRRK